MNSSRTQRGWISGVYALVILGLIVGLAACTKDSSNLTNAERDVVITLFNTETVFSSFSDYGMLDTVAVVGDTTAIDPATQTTILNAIKSNMSKYGWTQQTDTTITPDVILTARVSLIDNYGAYVGYPYYPYYPWYGGGWGIWYPWYPPTGGSVYSYTTGTIFIDMLPTSSASPSDSLLASDWVAAVNGVVTQTGNQAQRITDRIDQAYEQSPYLNLNDTQ